MQYDNAIHRYRHRYALLLRLYPASYYKRFGEGMEQTFGDLLRERAVSSRGLFGCVLWLFVEAVAGIIREHMNIMFTQFRTLYFVIGALCLLLIPFFAMQMHVGGWDWDATDFTVMAVLLTGFGLGLAAATNSAYSLRGRLIGIGCVALLLVIYVHLAVGIVDSWPFAGS